jgi:L-lactate dehydrogenase complex protein LldG
MKISPAKENILKKIRKALSTPVPLPFPQSEGNNSVFQPATEELELIFAEEFSKLQGKFVYCAGYKELVEQLSTLVRQMKWTEIYCVEEDIKAKFTEHGYTQFSERPLESSHAAVTGCELLIARTGTIVMSSAAQSGRTTSVYAPVHICIAGMNQLVYDVREGLQKLRDKYKGKMPSFITFASGPSRTADIEKTLVVGVHGPKEVFLFLLDQPTP